MGAASPWEESFGRWRGDSRAPGFDLANETTAQRRMRERTQRNAYFTEEFIEVLATIYEWQTVQKYMDGSHPHLQSEWIQDHQRERFNTPEKMRRTLLQNGAEPWMFEEIPAPGAERMAFFAEKSTPERRYRVFPYAFALKPWHVEEIRNERDPFTDPRMDPNKNAGDPNDWQDFAIADRTLPWDLSQANHPRTGAPIYGFNLGELVLPGSPWYEQGGVHSIGFTDLPKLYWKMLKGAVGQRSEQRDRLMVDHATEIRADPRYKAAYESELLRLRNLTPEQRENLYSEEGDMGFESIFGSEDIIRRLRPGYIPTTGSLRGTIPGTEWHRRDQGGTGFELLPLGLGSGKYGAGIFGTESGRPETRGEKVDIAEALAIAEAHEFYRNQMGVKQTKAENLQHDYDFGHLTEDEYKTKIRELLHVGATGGGSSQPTTPAAGGQTPAPAPSPGQTPAPQEGAAPPEEPPPGEDFIFRKSVYGGAL